MNQRTLKAPIEIQGKTLHFAKDVTMTIRPAAAGSGLVFKRVDLEGAPEIPVQPTSIAWDKLDNRTTLHIGEVEVATPEHVLSALAGMGIDNALIEIDGDEVPALDNSAKVYVEKILAVGIEEQDAPREFVTITEPVTVRDEKSGAEVTAMPSEHFEVSYFAEFPPGFFQTQQAVNHPVTPENYAQKIAPARTWIFKELIEELKKRGLGKGGSLETVLVIDRDGYVNEERLKNEPATHKALDLIGDLAVLGRPLQAHVLARRSGHALNASLVQKIANMNS